MQKPSEVVLVTCGATTIDHARFLCKFIIL